MKYDIEYTLPNPKLTIWKEAIHFENEFVLLGVNHEQNLMVSRGNLQGDVEFYEWEEKIENWSNIVIQSQPEITNTIFILHQNHQPFTEKRLLSNNVFKSDLFIGGIPNYLGNLDYLQKISRITEMSMGSILFLEQENMIHISSSINEINENDFINHQLKKIPHRPIHPMYTIRWIQSQEYRELEDEEIYTFYDNIFCVIGKKQNEILTNFFPLKEKILKIITIGDGVCIVTEKSIFIYIIYENEIKPVYQWKYKPTFSFIDIKYDINHFILFHFSEKMDLGINKFSEFQEIVIVFTPEIKEKYQFKLKNSIQVILPSLEEGKYYFLENSGNVVSYEI